MFTATCTARFFNFLLCFLGGFCFISIELSHASTLFALCKKLGWLEHRYKDNFPSESIKHFWFRWVKINAIQGQKQVGRKDENPAGKFLRFEIFWVSKQQQQNWMMWYFVWRVASTCFDGEDSLPPQSGSPGAGSRAAGRDTSAVTRTWRSSDWLGGGQVNQNCSHLSIFFFFKSIHRTTFKSSKLARSDVWPGQQHRQVWSAAFSPPGTAALSRSPGEKKKRIMKTSTTEAEEGLWRRATGAPSFKDWLREEEKRKEERRIIVCPTQLANL